MRQIQKGSIDISVEIYIIDDTNGTPETGVVFDSAGIDLNFHRDGEAVTSITEIDLTTPALTDAHEDGGFLHVANGRFRFDVPDAAFATGVSQVTIGGTVTGMVVLPVTIQLVNFDPDDAVRMGLTSLPNAVVEGAGGLFTRGTGAGQINQSANGQIDSNIERLNNAAQSLLDLKDFADAGYDPVANKVQGVVLSDTVTVLTNLPTIPTNWLTAAGIAASALNGKGDWNIGKTGYDLSTAGILAIWHQALTAIATAGSIGKLLKDEITAVRMAILTDWIDNGRLDLLLDAIPTNDIGAAGAGLTAIPWNASWDAQVESEVNDALVALKLDHLIAVAESDEPVDNSIIAKLAAKGVTADWSTFDNTTESLQAILDRGDAGWTTGAGTGLTPLASGTAQGGTVSTIQLASGESFADDELNGNVVKITSGVGAGQSRVIIGYNGSLDTATVERNWTTNPTATSVYEIVEGSVNVSAVGLAAEDIAREATLTARTLVAASYFDPTTDTVATVTTLTNLPSITSNWLTAAGINAGALNGKGDWSLATALATAQLDLNTITGSDGTTLATAQGNYSPSKAGDAMILTTAGILAIWHQLNSAIATAGSMGRLLKDEITAVRMATLTDWINTGRLDTILDGIKTVTDILPDAGALTTIAADAARLTAARAQVLTDWINAGRLDSILDSRMAEASINTTTGVVDSVTTLTGHTPQTADHTANISTIKTKTDNLPDGIKKNVALSNFAFFMVDSTDHVSAKTGLSITSQRRIDEGSFAATANTAIEVANGFYSIDFDASDLNGDVIALRFIGTGADDRAITILTQV